MSSTRDLTPEPVAAAKKRSRGKKDKKKPDGTNEDDDEEFTIISKSKAHKEIKVDPKATFGGDMFCPRYAFRTVEIIYVMSATSVTNPKWVSQS